MSAIKNRDLTNNTESVPQITEIQQITLKVCHKEQRFRQEHWMYAIKYGDLTNNTECLP